jgi:CxxC motif-containing protein (DUF1111 family)
VACLVACAAAGNAAGGAEGGRAERFRMTGTLSSEGVSAEGGAARRGDAREAPAGFDNVTNGYLPQGPPFESLDGDTVEALRSFNDNRFIFEEVEHVGDGLGPTYNGTSCVECHQSVVTGSHSQVAEHRTGRLVDDQFFESIGGSLIHSRGTAAEVVEHVAGGDAVRTFRLSTSTLGDGFVECIANGTLLAIRNDQPARMRGNAVGVPVLEAGGQVRLGRFGWKCQHASLESFAADAYLNEMGITNPLFPEENTASGVFVGYGSDYDAVPEPEDDGEDLVAFADFIRATKVPPRGPLTADVTAGERVFGNIGCATCHVPTIVTAPPGTSINGGAFVVPEALGNKVIHPYSDFLLHDVGTGDGVPLLPTAEMAATANQIRTAPLWGLRTRNRLMHDGLTFTVDEAIRRHRGQASGAATAYARLSGSNRRQLLAFLNSL